MGLEFEKAEWDFLGPEEFVGCFDDRWIKDEKFSLVTVTLSQFLVKCTLIFQRDGLA